MGIRNFPVITSGANTATRQLNIAAAGNIVIPNTEGGSGPKYLMLILTGGAAGDIITVSPQVAATNGSAATGIPMHRDFPWPLILNVHGFTHIGFDVIAGTTSDLYLIPLEDF